MVNISPTPSKWSILAFLQPVEHWAALRSRPNGNHWTNTVANWTNFLTVFFFLLLPIELPACIMTARHWVSTWYHFNIFNGRLNGTGIEVFFFFRCSIGLNRSSPQSGPGGIVFHCWKCLLTAGNMAACGSFWVVCESAFRTGLHMSNGHVAANKCFTVQEGRTQMWRDVRAYVTLRMSQDKRQKKKRRKKKQKTATPATPMSQNTLSRTKDLYAIWENRRSLHYKCNKTLSSQVV